MMPAMRPSLHSIALGLSSLMTLLAAPTASAQQPDAEPPQTLGQLARIHSLQFRAQPVLLSIDIGVGLEPHDNGVMPGDSTSEITNSPIAFHVGGEALWLGVVGPALGLYASEGAPVLVPSNNGNPRPSLGDRVSVVGALALRPLAWLAWRRGDSWVSRLAAGLGVEVGVSEEITRTSLDTGLSLGFHGMLFAEVPLYGGGSMGGLALRVSARLLVSHDQLLACKTPPPSGQSCSPQYTPQIVEPGVAAQLFAGFAYYL